MPLGYVLKTEQVLEYYVRKDIAEAIYRYGKDRNIIMTTDPGTLGRGGGQPGFRSPDEIPAMAMKAMEGMEGTIPKKYPGFHGTIGRKQNGADLVIDIDVKGNYKEAFKEGRKVITFLDSCNIPYRIKFSGGSGPHIIIPYEAFPENLSGGSFNKAHKMLFQTISSGSKANNIDGSFTSTGHFHRLPYSLNEHTGLVSLPLRRDQYDDFTPSMAEVHNIQIDEEWFQQPDEKSRDVMAGMIKDKWGIIKENIDLTVEVEPVFEQQSHTVEEIQKRVDEHINRLKRLAELGAPDKVIRNEKKMLNEVMKMFKRNKIRIKSRFKNGSEENE
jgi:hypothetical protein